MREDRDREIRTEPETPFESFMTALMVCVLIYFLMFL